MSRFTNIAWNFSSIGEVTFSFSHITMKNKHFSTARIITIVVILIVGIAWYLSYWSALSWNFWRSKWSWNNIVTNTVPSQITKSNLSSEQINHVIDLHNEERLAHDVYVYLYEKRGIKQFGNILQSEIQHYTLVENILQSYKIEYDKNTTVGVYSTPWYTELYNTLIEKWSISPSDAIAVWVQIETMDIADIQKLYPEFESYSNITTMLQKLEQWSRNHLAAFSRSK